jgi:lysophospholipase L1-like esterase
VDGGAPTTINAASGSAFTDGNLTRVSLGASGDHTVVITASGTQSVIDGIVVYDGDETSSVRVHACGHYGFTSGDWLSPNTANLKVSVAALNPHALVIEGGLNDYNNATQGINATGYRTNLQTLVSDVRSQITTHTLPVVFLSAPQPKDDTFIPPNDPYTSYRDALYSLADSIGNAVVFDAGLRLSSYTSGNRYGQWNDPLHMNDVGQAALGDALARFLMPA